MNKLKKELVMKTVILLFCLSLSFYSEANGKNYNNDGKLPLTSVKWGGSGCKSVQTWYRVLDANLQNDFKTAGNLLKSCKWVAEGSSITGPLETVEYKGSKFEKFSHPSSVHCISL